jgi:hypothetical protein
MNNHAVDYFRAEYFYLRLSSILTTTQEQACLYIHKTDVFEQTTEINTLVQK